ncbi:hypothetical protein ZIOFF_069887 [Zingiber officinale]|uniref:Enoyl-ACP reductase n=1 Tax=Zingiber officinale TaxID=94328 RepID=A0A8J5C4S4_ZINOF|nr:hypothetical protein ZIOFF_069887 [Zingiber officinale]
MILSFPPCSAARCLPSPTPFFPSAQTGFFPLRSNQDELKGKRAFIAGVVDDNGYGWAITKALVAAGEEILVDCIYILPNGSLMNIVKVYPLDAVCDTPDDVPEDVKTNKRYAGSSNWTVKEMAEAVAKDFGRIDILVHSLANGPEVTKPLLETSRRGYLATISASSYSFVSLLRHFLPIMNPGFFRFHENKTITCSICVYIST